MPCPPGGCWEPSRRLPIPFGLCFLLLAASQSLPMTANNLLIYRRLNLTTEQASAYFLAYFLPSFTAPIFGWITDRGGVRARYWTIVISLALKACALAAFAFGLVRSLGSLYLFGILAPLAHTAALATIDGALCSRGGGSAGDTSLARGRQAAKLAWQTTGDLLAALVSLLFAATDAPLPVVYGLTACVNASAACASHFLPHHPPPVDSRTAVATAEGCAPGEREAGLLASEVRVPSDSTSDDAAAAGAAADATAASSASRRAAAGAVIAALAIAVYMLPPTADVATGSYVAQPNSTASWVLSAQQLSSMAGGLGGIGLAARLDLPLHQALPLGAVATAASQLISLMVYALAGRKRNEAGVHLDGSAGGVAVLLLEPAASNALRLVGVVPILAMCAAASEGAGEGAAYGLVAAADAVGALAAGTISTIMVGALHIGAPPEASWARLPLMVAVCASCKVALVPAVLLLLRLREWVMPGKSDGYSSSVLRR